jgi:uncharacterized glyoxalase superfamily protein PhnB
MLKVAHPGLAVKDMHAALTFYEHKLGFRCTFKVHDDLHPEIPYAIVRRDEVELHLSRSGDSAGRASCYIDVDDADALFEEFRRAGVEIQRAIEDSSYGMRDFNIKDLDGNVLGFGQPI